MGQQEQIKNDSTPQINRTEILSALDSIIKSPSFKSLNHRQFLTYLVHKALEGAPPKETTIAIELFKDNLEEQKDTSYVRVRAYNVRKKLKEYYLTEGKDDPIQLTLAKGAYKIGYTRLHTVIDQELEKEIETDSQKDRDFSKYYWVLTAVVLFFLGFFFGKFNTETKVPATQTFLFEELSINEKPVLVVLGDLFMYAEDNGSLIRDYRINHFEDLANAKPELAEINKKISRSKYMTRSNAISLFHISTMLNALDKEIFFRMGSELTLEDLKENNILFFGMFKSLYLLDSYYHISNFEPIETYGKLRNKSTGDTLAIQGDPGAAHTDYGVFSRINGINDNLIFIIAGFTDTSIERISSALAEPDFKTQILEPSFSNDVLTPNFEVVFEVEGYDRKEVSGLKVQEAHSLESGMVLR